MPRGELPVGDNWFVGRVRESAAIGACVDAVSGGAGRVVWVEGDPGSGKTALINHVLAELPAAFVVLRAAADESTVHQPFVLHQRFGQLLAAQGGKRRQAVDQLRLAHDLFARAGAEPFLHRVEADLAPHSAAVGRPGARSPLELTDRERDIAVLVAKGMTNREVAAELYVSPKAVDYHLGHIFGKLGITSRRDLRQLVLN